ncbi:MAG: dimethylarginine dimethylaminohydrolase family protein [Armatimonadota bacterium]
MRELLMVPPAHYTVAYEINPWMNRVRAVSQEAAAGQWEGLRRVLTEEMGAVVHLAEPQPGLPDMVFTANAGLVLGETAIVSRFRHLERQGEAPHFARWFAERSFRVVELPADCFFEGEGDALFLDDTLFAGYQWRTDVRAHRAVEEILGVRTLSLRLVDPHFYHLDTCFCPLDAETVAYYPGAFDDYGREVIRANARETVEVVPDEAQRFACNALVLGRHVALNTGCPQFEAQLRERGFVPHATPLDEFLKAGGSAKCLTLHLDRPAFLEHGGRTIESGELAVPG